MCLDLISWCRIHPLPSINLAWFDLNCFFVNVYYICNMRMLRRRLFWTIFLMFSSIVNVLQGGPRCLLSSTSCPFLNLIYHLKTWIYDLLSFPYTPVNIFRHSVGDLIWNFELTRCSTLKLDIIPAVPMILSILNKVWM